MDTWNKFWLTMVIIGLLCQSAISVGGICAQIVHGNFYELSALSSEDDYVLDVSNMNGKIYFNLCSYARTKCAGMSNSFAVFKNDDLCIPLTTSSLTSSYNSSLIKYTDGTSGLNISFEGIVNQDEEAISSNATKYKVEFDLQCISGQTNYNWNNPSPHFYAENGTFVVRGQGAVNCPKYNGSFIVDFMNKFSFLYAILAILIGSGLSFYGYKLYRPTIFTIGFLFGFIAIGLFLFAVWTSQDSSQYKGWIILILALVAGTGAGLLVITFAWIGLVASGAILGFFIALIAYLLVLYHIVSYPPNLLFYNILLVGMVGGAISGYEFQDIILVLSCGISGAYLVVRGLSVFFGGFPNEFELASKIRTGQDTGIGLAFFFYMILMAGAAAGGIWYQLKLKKEDHDRAEGNDIAEGLAAKELN